MAFKASNIVPARGYFLARDRAVRLSALAINASARLDANVSGEQIVNYLGNLTRSKADLESYKTIAGIVDYAKNQENDPSYDIAAEFTSLLSAIDAAINTIKGTAISAMLDGWGDGDVVWATFTPVQTASLKANLDAIVAAVE